MSRQPGIVGGRGAKRSGSGTAVTRKQKRGLQARLCVKLLDKKKKGNLLSRFSEERKQERRRLVKNAGGEYEVMRSFCFSGERKKEK